MSTSDSPNQIPLAGHLHHNLEREGIFYSKIARSIVESMATEVDVNLLANIGRTAVGMIIGYFLFVIGTIVIRLPFEPLSYATAGAAKLAIAALFVPWAGFIGGLVTAMIVPARPMLCIIPACILIAAESTYLFVTGRTDGPLWFESGAALSLIIAYVVGCAAWTWRASLLARIRRAPSTHHSA